MADEAPSARIARCQCGALEAPPPAYEVYTECAMAGLNLQIEPEPERQ